MDSSHTDAVAAGASSSSDGDATTRTSHPRHSLAGLLDTWTSHAFQLFFVVLQVARLSLLSASIYLWNYNHTVLAYIGFASVLSARHLLWTTLEGSLHQSLRMGRPSAGLGLKLLLLAAPVYWFALSLQELVSSLEWRSLMMLVYPLLLRLSAQQMVPGIKEGAESLGELARLPHFKFGTLTMIVTTLLRNAFFDFIEGGYYGGLLPLMLKPEEQAVVDWMQCSVLVFLCFFDSGSLAVLDVYQAHGRGLYLHARRLGSWRQCTANASTTWQTGQTFAKGTIVRHRKKSYKALDISNTAEPSDVVAGYFWRLFRHPDASVGILSAQQAAAIGLQLLPLLFARHWLIVSIWAGSLAVSFLALGYGLLLRRRLRRCQEEEEHTQASQPPSLPNGSPTPR